MLFSNLYFYLVGSTVFLAGAAMPSPQLGNLQLVGETVEFNASCWDTTTFDGPKASRADLLAVADLVRRRTSCVMERDKEVLYKHELAHHSSGVEANLVWTQAELNKGIRKATFSCSTIASRIERTVNACAAIFGSESIAVWTVMNACDASQVEKFDGSGAWPVYGESGAALNVMSGENLIPDYKEKRAPLPFIRLRLLQQEDAAPVPGWEITS